LNDKYISSLEMNSIDEHVCAMWCTVNT